LNADVLDREFVDAKAKADDAYDKADKLLQAVMTAPSNNPLTKSARDAARAAQVVATYGRSQFEAVVGDADNSSRALSDSKRLRDAMIADNVPLPSPLPLEIAIAPVVSSPSDTNPNPTTVPGRSPSLPAPVSGPTTVLTGAPGDTTATKPAAQPAGVPGALPVPPPVPAK
jgi:hypothetical protein